MVIKSSTAAEVRALVESLASDDAVRRETAIARLAIIGPRATDRLLGAYAGADNHRRTALLRALEGIGDARALAPASEAMHGGGDAAIAAAALLKRLLDDRDAVVATAALDALVEAALNPAGERRVRLAALDALQGVPLPIRARIQSALADQEATGEMATDEQEALVADALEGRLPDDPRLLADALIGRGRDIPLPALLQLVERTRDRERTDPARGALWVEVRAAAHRVLASRGSRLGVYDLRESVAAARTALPTGFLSAMRQVGDASCVEPLAQALAHASPDDLWWQHQLASALRGIVKRERLTKRHPAIKRALERCPAAAGAIG